MWCSDCEQEFRTVPDAEVQVCPRCRAAAKAGQRQRQRRVPSLDSPANPKRTIVRIDSAHPRKLSETDTPQKGDSDTRTTLPTIPNVNIPATVVSHRVLFGLFVFLVGEAILIWADLAGHSLALRVGHLVAIVGLSLAFFSVTVALRRLEDRFQDFTRRQERTSTKKTRRQSRQSSKAKR